MGENWHTKYAPQNLNKMVVAPEKRQKLKRVIQDLPNTMLHGVQGIGKSTFMSILLKKKNVDYLTINASNKNGIDIVRGEVEKFAKVFSLKSQIKIIYFEEADNLTEDAQNALKFLIDKVHKTTRFFFLCNNDENMIDPIKSRCTYKLNLEDPPKKDINRYINDILSSENISIKNYKDIEKVIDFYYPDIRSIVGHLQSNIADNKLLLNEFISYSLVERKKLTADQKRESDRIRVKKWHEKQKQKGNKQISCVISREAYDILQNIDGSYGEIIDKLLLGYGKKE